MEDSAYVSKTAITLDFTGYTDDIAKTLRCVGCNFCDTETIVREKLNDPIAHKRI